MNITIVGAGFAGVKAALELARDSKNRITVISDKPDFQYYPSLYSSATGHSHLESWVPLGEIFADHDNIHVYIDRIVGIDDTKKRLTGATGAEYDYQTCLIAVGTVTTYFGIPGLDQYSYGIKSAEEIRRLKERIYEDLVGKRAVDRNYVVVGGGPTGVELAAALGTYLRRLAKYHRISSHSMSIQLIEAAPRVLPRSHEKVSARVQRRLEKLGVKVRTGAMVQKETADSLMVSGKPLSSHTVIWTSGVANNPLFSAHPHIFELAKNGRVVVDKYLRAAKGIYVLGDNAATPFTGLAQTALHDGRFVAKNFQRRANGRSVKPYKAVQPASVIPVGKNWSAFEWKKIRFYGWPASVVRRSADFLGYTDILPIGQALRPWSAARMHEKDYFAPVPKMSLARKRAKK